MEAYAYQLLKIGQFASLALSWVIMTVSAAAAVALTKSQWKLGRAGYFLSMGFIVLLAVIPNFLLIYTAEAIKDGYLALLLGAIYAALVPIGGLAGIFAAARSMDAHGTREKWVFGFIPIMNLLLLFSDSMASSKKGFVKLLGSAAMVILGFSLMFAGKSLENVAKQNIQRVATRTQDDLALQAKTMEYEVKNKGLEKYLKEIASAVSVPEEIDKITTLTALHAEGRALIYTYEISGADSKFDKAWKDLMMSRWCAPGELKPMFDIGALVTGHYVDSDGNTLAEISASPSLCAAWSEALDVELKAAAQSIKGPVKVDAVTTLTGVSYESKTYSYHYTVSVALHDLWKDVVKANFCKSPDMRAITDLGVTVRGVYTLENGTPIGEVSIDKTACPAS